MFKIGCHLSSPLTICYKYTVDGKYCTLCLTVTWCQSAWGTMETGFVYFQLLKWAVHQGYFYQVGVTVDLRTDLPFCVRRTLMGNTGKIYTWVDICSLSGDDLTAQCHLQFEMDRINICGIFETIGVIQGQHGLPQYRCKATESTVLASKWHDFLISRENTNNWQQDKELSVLGNMLVCFSFSLERIHCLRFDILFLLPCSLSKVKVGERWSSVSVWNAPFWKVSMA